ncbi:retropepsin-like domain-containing protein [Sphingosinicellaceae bacterium]|nr:retropepsin-like domain-containing protein [Sphingosinicellaceae bacterium]
MRFIDRRFFMAAGAALALLPGTAGAQPVQMKRAGGHLLIPVTVGGRTVDAVLDTAAEASVVDKAFAAELGLKGYRTATARGSGAASIQTQLVKGVVLQVAGLTLRPRFVAIIDLGDIGRRLIGRPISMILGREFFDASRIAVDVDAATLTPLDRSREPAGKRVALTPRRGVEQVAVTIEGIAATADFDIGNAGHVLIGEAFAARHGFLTGRPLGSIGGGGIGGEARQSTLALKSLDIAGRRFTNIVAAVDANPEAADCNVGTQVLRSFGIVADFARHAVWLDARA